MFSVNQTSSYASSFLLAMALYPNVQKKAQAEVDNVIGSTRLPEFEDLEHLAYVRAVIKETLRWMPVLPFGVPHALTEDDVYKGYHLPKGATVIPVSIALDTLLSGKTNRLVYQNIWCAVQCK